MQNPNIENHGKNNQFILIKKDGSIEENPYIEGLKVIFFGDNNKVILYEPLPRFSRSTIQLLTKATFILHESKYFVQNLIVWKMRANTKVEIGKNFSCVSMQIAMHCEDNLEVFIGDECMVSHDVYIQPSDAHAIIDKDTLKALNYGKSISIGSHIWLGPYSMICKGVNIASDVVIGSHSIVTKNLLDGNCVYVGSPPRKVRNNIIWTRSSPYDYERKEEYKHILDNWK